VWIYANNQLQPVRVRLGITDGQATELLEGDLEPGAEVVTNVTTGNETRPTAAQGGFPFMGGPPGGRGGFGGPGGGGGNRGGGGR
jgi:HlyD family secretion protein